MRVLSGRIAAARLAAFVAAFVVALAMPQAARAEHEHGPIAPPAGTPDSMFTASLGVVAADYDTMYYGGDYEGIVPSLSWARGRFGAAATLPMYRIVGNGRTSFGIGDALVHTQATLVGDRSLALGTVVAVGIPTGESRTGLGMGHVMVMPAGFITAELAQLSFVGSVGYGRALAHDEHDHGAWPLVDPMTESEITFSATADYAIARSWHAGVRTLGAISLVDSPSRLVAGARGGWSSGRIATTVELQVGVAGDPFRIRGVLQTALRF